MELFRWLLEAVFIFTVSAEEMEFYRVKLVNRKFFAVLQVLQLLDAINS